MMSEGAWFYFNPKTRKAKGPYPTNEDAIRAGLRVWGMTREEYDRQLGETSNDLLQH